MNLVLSRRARLIIRYAVQAFPHREIQGFGAVEKCSDDNLWVTDLIIPKQEVTGASVSLEPHDLEELMLELSKRGESLSHWPLWWHSHGQMETFASRTDEETLTMLAKEYGGIALGLVTNKDESYFGWWAGTLTTEWGDFDTGGKMEIMVEADEDAELETLVGSMMKNVSVKSPPPPMFPGIYNPNDIQPKNRKKKRRNNKNGGEIIIGDDFDDFNTPWWMKGYGIND